MFVSDKLAAWPVTGETEIRFKDSQGGADIGFYKKMVTDGKGKKIHSKTGNARKSNTYIYVYLSHAWFPK